MENNEKKRLPGYPHYPSNEDITNPGNNAGKEDINVEKVPASHTFETPEKNPVSRNETGTEEEDTEIVMGTEADVTPEDLKALRATDQDMDAEDELDIENATPDNEDEDGDILNEDDADEDMIGKDLDVPGSEADDADENIGEEDEENNYYSLGGDEHEAQEEDNGE